ncbi:glycoside hydrolase domain-containing protein [Streptomyces erythrochromogenes]|uniref:glycoside hydrolase domain-containing protein n=1 Tax=Streptomyces erythrochromogenes TaxID=285574 RepID=UPI003802ADD0
MCGGTEPAGLGLIAVAVTGVLSVLVTWWADPIDRVNLDRFTALMFSGRAASAGVKTLSAHHHQAPEAMPDVLWVARWNLSASVSDADMGLPARTTQWAGPRRAHPFRGDHDATYGGVTLNIDRSRVDVDPSALGPAAAAPAGRKPF